ncbi:MAG: PQQ-binding-like beta-propeller repeat protein [Planctomycetota bacterium]|nr:PQQ-binding-like beta-propeller repeat protein [Planctomycetota bacterium]
MRKHRKEMTLVLVAFLASIGVAQEARPDRPGVAAAESAAPHHQWPQWRGPLATGVAPHGDPPIEWGETRNLRWKTPLPGHGHSTPIVWGEMIFLTMAVPFGKALEPRPSTAPGAHDNSPVTHRQRFVVAGLDRRSGKILWQRPVREELPREQGHVSGTLASPSAVTNGRKIFASFGSFGIYALDLDGALVWEKDLGEMATKHGHGEGSSPVLHGQTLFVNWDHEGESFVIALDTADGAERWRIARDEASSWATPIVVEQAGRHQLIVPGTKRVRAYDTDSGEIVWECSGLSRNIVASPVAGHGMVFAGSSYDTRAMYGIRLDGSLGDITGTDQVVWSRRTRTPYVPSLLLLGEDLYFLRHYQNILTRVIASTGAEPGGPLRLEGLGNIYASPVAAAGRIYITDREGSTMVLAHGETPEILALNRIDEGVSASAAIVGDMIFLRGETSLYAFGAR